MNTKKSNILIFILFLPLVFSTCKKDIDASEFSPNIIGAKIKNLEGYQSLSLGEMFKRPGGGFVFKSIGSTNQISNDIIINFTDENLNIIRSTVVGGSLDERGAMLMDESGDIYVAGATNSPELRMDGAIRKLNTYDGYLAKINSSGDLLWQIGFSDTTAGHKGVQNDYFNSIEIIDNKLYCMGWTYNFTTNVNVSVPDRDLWLAVFDKDGNFLSQRILPSLHVFPLSLVGSNYMGGLKLSNGDLLFRMTNSEWLNAARTFDTTCVISRYRPSTDSILWTQYFEKNSPQGDLWTFFEKSNGNLISLTSLNKNIVTLDGSTGLVLGSKLIGLIPDDKIYLAQPSAESFKRIDGGYYIHGQALNNLAITLTGKSSLLDSRPWVMKITEDGTLDYSKIYPIEQAGFTSMLEVQNGNLLFLGFLSKFGTQKTSAFFQKTDKEGNLIDKD